MADSRRPALQMFDQLFGDEQHAQNLGLDNLKTYLEQGGSIFPLVEKGVQGLVREQRLSPDDARRFLRGANSMATYLRRQFIEQTLTGDRNATTRSSSGLLSMVDGPTYQVLIGTDFAALCPPDALESLVSPIAYLIDLLRWIRDRIKPENQEEQYQLHNRRTDLLALEVDVNAVYQSVSSVDIIVAVLEQFIAANKPKPGQSTEDALIEARYPNGLPYYQHWVTIDAIAQSHDLSVGDFEHRVDLAYPYFLQPDARGTNTGPGFAHATRLGPYQRQLLTEARESYDQRKEFFDRHFGTNDLDSYQNLSQVEFLGERTKLSSTQIEALLSIRDAAPVRSANVKYPDETPEIPEAPEIPEIPEIPEKPESERSGSVYINNNTAPAVRIDDESQFRHRLTADPDKELGFNRYDRINQMVRLANWTGLPFDQVDALLVAAIRAVEHGNPSDPAAASEMDISSGVVHALGLFQTLRERYECTAADFAGFIAELSIYGRGEALSLFDQIFNDRTDYREPLRLDNLTFPVTPAPGEVDLTISQLCRGLAIDPQTYYVLATTVARAHELTDTLTRSPAIISSFYRLVRLPRLLNITPVEGVLMLSVLGGIEWVDGLAGIPRIHTVAEGPPDVLELIEAMHSCVQWCAQSDLPVLWVLQHAVEPLAAEQPSEQDQQLFEQLRNLLPTALLSNGVFLMAGVPSAGVADWLEFLVSRADGLVPIVDAYGLVLPQWGTSEQYLDDVRGKIAWAVDSALGVVEGALRQTLIDIMTGVVLQARDAQASLVKETLAVYAGVGVEQVLPILSWSNTTVHQLLQHVLEQTPVESEGPSRKQHRNANVLLDLLAQVRRRSEVVSTLGLSAALLHEYLDYGHEAWLGQSNRHALTIRTLYFLTTLTRAFALGEQPPQKLLDYLRQVNDLPDVTGDAMRLAQQAAAIKLANFFGWSVQEVRECVDRIDPTNLKVLKNLSQLDLLMRVRELSIETGMDALTIFLIGSLPETIDKTAYAKAAELALLGATSERAPVAHVASDLNELVSITCDVVDGSDVVANKPGELATYRVTVKNAQGQPLSGIKVHWRASLGSIKTGATDTNGTLLVIYTPGKVMGTDTPVYWLDLFEPRYAPSIDITFDHKTLTFPLAEMSPTPLGVVPEGQEVELYALLEDFYGNRAYDSLVDWYWVTVPPTNVDTATIRPRQGFTDQQGLTRVFVSSETGGTFVFSVRSQSGDSESVFINPITFAGEAIPG